MSDNPSVTSTTSTTHGTGARIDRYDPAEIEPRWQQRWDELGMHHTDLDDDVAAEVLPADDVPLPVGRPAHRPLVHQDADRRARPLPAHERPQRLLPHRLRRLRAAGRERRHQERRPPGDWTMRNIENMRRQFRTHGRDVRLGERGRHLPARLLPLEPVVLPALPRGRPGLSPDGARRLVPQGPGRAGARAGRGRRPRLLALRHAGHQARPGAVVLPHHEVRGRAARLRGHRLARADPAHADELDRPLRGRRGRLPHRAVRPPRGRRGAARLHDPSGHAVRGHVHGPGAGAPAGRRADRARAARGRRGVRRRRRAARPRSSGCRPTARRPACPSARTPSTRSTASASPSGSPTTCCRATAPARSWPCPATTSATSRSRSASACPSAGWSPAPTTPTMRRSTEAVRHEGRVARGS